MGVPTSDRDSRSGESLNELCDCTNTSMSSTLDLKTISMFLILLFQSIILLKLFGKTVLKCFRRSKMTKVNSNQSNAESSKIVENILVDSRTAQIL